MGASPVVEVGVVRVKGHFIAQASVILALISISTAAQARSQRNLAYRADSAWTAAIRMLRVDMGFELIERDAAARFLLFRYVEGEQAFPGSLEIVERSLEDGRLGVRVIVSVPAMPTYVELHLIDRLERKLLDEVGPPLPAPERVARRGAASEDDADREEGQEEAESPSEE